MFRPDQNGDLLQPRLSMAFAQQSKAAIHAKAQVQDDGSGRFRQVRHYIVEMVLSFLYTGDQLHAVITQLMQGPGTSVRKSGLVLNKQDDLAKRAHLLVELRQRCLGNVTSFVVYDLYQRLGQQFMIALTGGQLVFCYARFLAGILGERRSVFRTDGIFRFMLIGHWMAPYEEKRTG